MKRIIDLPKEAAIVRGEASMKQLISRLCIVGLLITFVTGISYGGRGDKVGTSAASELLIPIGARSIALGSSSVAMTRGIEAIYWNPAGLARATHNSNAMFTHMNYIADIGVEYLAVSSTFAGFGTIGMSVKALSFGDIPITTEDQPDGTGELTSPTFVTVGATYSRQLADRIAVGATINLISERMERVNSSGIAFNIGVQYSGVAGIEGFSLGVVVKNIGPQMQYGGPGLLRTGQIDDVTRPSSFYQVQAATAELPSVMELGLGYSTTLNPSNKLSLTGLFQNNNFSDDEYKVGMEYSYNDLLFLRGGYIFTSETTGLESIYGGTAGVGVHTDLSDVDISIDYAYRSVEFFGGSHVFGISFGF